MSSKPPVFIVGVPRSGTTLLAAMLAAHRNMSCGPETHFFRWLERADQIALTAPEHWPGRAVDFISSIIRKSYTAESPRPLIEKYGLSREEIAQSLIAQPPSIAALLSSITETHMQKHEKQRWVEKTPDHIKYLAEIRSAFPEARILRILRDPRDIALSLSKVPWGVQSFFEGLIYWKSLDDASRDFFATDHNTYTLRFEDLIQAPEQELSKLCSFIGEPFDEQMLDTSHTGKQLNSRKVPWKEKASQPIDQNRIMVWQKEINPAENQLAEAYLGDQLEQYHYPRLVEFTGYGYAFPGDQLVPKYESELSTIAGSGIRFWQKDTREKPQALIVIGDPADAEWANSYPGSIFRNQMALVSELVKNKLSRRKTFWVSPGTSAHWTGFSAQVIKSLLSSDRLPGFQNSQS